ncbi:unnamed protein product [Gongylonema pulchrum]|uniref:Senescence domain-containing protein n=1 Tax=Gongylonema pulchrum TaxID=637853 RepID=A0A183DNU6_9BILA|nr:unnamed protein product [Gongylonema pulchrum]
MDPGSEELRSGVLPRAQEFKESTLEKLTEVASAGAGEVTQGAGAAYKAGADLASEALHSAREVGGAAASALGDTIHLVDDAAGHVGALAHGAYGDIASTVKTARDTATHAFSEGVHKTADPMGDAAHHVAHTFGDAVHEAKGAGAVSGGAAGAVHSVEDTFDDLVQKFKGSGSDIRGVPAVKDEDLIGLSDVSSGTVGVKHEFDRGPDVKSYKPAGPGAAVKGEPWSSSWEQFGDRGGQVQRPEDTIHNEVADVHDQIESLIEKMHTARTPQHVDRVCFFAYHTSLSDASSVEENTYDRSGPLTIPSQVPRDTEAGVQGDKALQLGDSADSPTHRRGFRIYESDIKVKLRALSGFEVSPRPPTPPKELDDEDVKPTTIDVGQPAYKSSTAFFKSNLKTSSCL